MLVNKTHCFTWWRAPTLVAVKDASLWCCNIHVKCCLSLGFMTLLRGQMPSLNFFSFLFPKTRNIISLNMHIVPFFWPSIHSNLKNLNHLHKSDLRWGVSVAIERLPKVGLTEKCVYLQRQSALKKLYTKLDKGSKNKRSYELIFDDYLQQWLQIYPERNGANF